MDIKEDLQTQEPTQQPDNEQLGEGGLKALQSERQRAKQLEKQLKEFQAKLSQYESVNVDEYQQLKEFKTQQEKQAEEAKQKALEEARQYETAKQEIINKYENQINQIQQQLNEVKSIIDLKDQAINQTKINYLFSQSIGASDGFEQTANFLLKEEWITNKIRLENDQLVPIDSTGNPLTNGSGGLLTLKEWIEKEVKPKYPYLFKAPQIGGTGAMPSISNAKATQGISFEEFLKKSPAQILNEERARKGK